MRRGEIVRMSGTGLDELPAPPMERAEIVDYALALMTPAMGEPTSQLLPECVDGADAAEMIGKRFSLSRAQSYRYVQRARELIAAEFAAELPTRARLLSSISLAVVREAYRDRQYVAVNGAVRNLCTIYGIDAKVIVKGDGMSALLEAVKTSPGERDAEIARLEAKEREDGSGAVPG